MESPRRELERIFQVSLLIPKIVFVPFEWDTRKGEWLKRDDLPRFKETEEIQTYMAEHPGIHFRGKHPVPLTWIECDEWKYVHEYLRGVGTEEWLSIQH